MAIASKGRLNQTRSDAVEESLTSEIRSLRNRRGCLFIAPSPISIAVCAPIRVKAFRKMDLGARPEWNFASEMVIKSHAVKLRIQKCRTTHEPTDVRAPPHLRPWRDGWRQSCVSCCCAVRAGLFLLYPGLFDDRRRPWRGLGLLPSRREVYRFGSRRSHALLLTPAIAVIRRISRAVAFACLRGLRGPRRPVLAAQPACLEWLLEKLSTLDLGSRLDWSSSSSGKSRIGPHGVDTGASKCHMEISIPPETLRVVIPSCWRLRWDVQMVLSSFFMSVLALGVRK